MSNKDPSKSISCFQYPNIYIEDELAIFKSPLKSDTTYHFKSEDFKVLNATIQLLIYTSLPNKSKWSDISPTRNEIAVFITRQNQQLQFKIRLSDNLLKVSRFINRQQMLDCKVMFDEIKFKSREKSIASILSVFDTYDSALFPIRKVVDKTKRVRDISIEWKGSIPAKPVEVISSGKDKLDFIIGLFFDGTNNSRYNSEIAYKKIISKISEIENQPKTNNVIQEEPFKIALEEVMKEDIENGEFFTEGSSYLNDYTNIVFLHDAYKEYSGNNLVTIKHYIQGIGPETLVDINNNIKYKEDSDWIKGAGTSVTGKSGVTDRMKEGIRIAIQKIKQEIDKTKLEIGSITFDLFGFSRGATVARKFHNELSKEETIQYEVNGLKNYYRCIGGYFAECYFEFIVNRDINLMMKHYPNISKSVRFIGLFDTVNMTWSFPEISLAKSNAYCCHIFAREDDEYRLNFPLTISDCPNGVDIKLIGSHSDIGGGYANRKYKPIVERDNWVGDNNTSEKLNSLKEELVGLFVLEQNQLKQKQFKIFKINENPINHYGQKLASLELLDNREIKNDIHIASYNAIINIAKIYGIHFNENNELKTKENSDEKLKKYNSQVQELIESSFKSRKKNDLMNIEDYVFLYHKYIHISANYDIIKLDSENLPILKRLIVNIPNEGRKREIEDFK